MPWKGKRGTTLFIEMGRMLKYRKISKMEQTVREFEYPTLIFEEDDYTHLIQRQSVTYTEPLLALPIFDNELKAMILGVPAEIDVLRFPWHSHAVQHYVQ